MRLIIKESRRYELLQLLDKDGFTPLHWSALEGRTQHIRVIEGSVSSQQLVHLLRITEHLQELTPRQVAEQQGQEAAAELLQDCETKALGNCEGSGENFTYYLGSKYQLTVFSPPVFTGLSKIQFTQDVIILLMIAILLSQGKVRVR